jgi:hypothetical protein
MFEFKTQTQAVETATAVMGQLLQNDEFKKAEKDKRPLFHFCSKKSPCIYPKGVKMQICVQYYIIDTKHRVLFENFEYWIKTQSSDCALFLHNIQQSQSSGLGSVDEAIKV